MDHFKLCSVLISLMAIACLCTCFVPVDCSFLCKIICACQCIRPLLVKQDSAWSRYVCCSCREMLDKSCAQELVEPTTSGLTTLAATHQRIPDLAKSQLHLSVRMSEQSRDFHSPWENPCYKYRKFQWTIQNIMRRRMLK